MNIFARLNNFGKKAHTRTSVYQENPNEVWNDFKHEFDDMTPEEMKKTVSCFVSIWMLFASITALCFLAMW